MEIYDIALQEVNDMTIEMTKEHETITINTPHGSISIRIKDDQTIIHKDSNLDTNGIYSAEVGDPDGKDRPFAGWG